jgi:hypothetical protein
MNTMGNPATVMFDAPLPAPWFSFAVTNAPPPAMVTPSQPRGQATSAAPTRRPREIEQTILEASPRTSDGPITIKQLTRRAGYSYTPYFRDAVAALVDAGLLLRLRKGVRRHE